MTITRTRGLASILAALVLTTASLLVGVLTLGPAPAQAKKASASGACKASKSARSSGKRKRSCPTSIGGGGGSTPSGGSTTTSSPSSPPPSGGSTPPSGPAPNPNCPLAQPGSTIGMALPSSCTEIASDTASNPSPLGFWGKLDCANASRHQQITSGGDGHSMGSGSGQGNSSFRRISVLDGDDVWGERCEMGYNWGTPDDPGTGVDGPGPTVFYHEGERRVTYMSMRLGSNWNVNDPNWRTVMQMKQVQPYYNPTGGSMFEVQVRSGQWNIISDWSDPLWTAPAQAGVWTRFAFDITYSSDPSIGTIKVYVDLNNDGDANDANEQSPLIHRATLKAELPGGVSPYLPGQSIPSHLRAGVYQNSNYNCPAPSGCYADYDNVQVFRA